jgi:hypothetical protein
MRAAPDCRPPPTARHAPPPRTSTSHPPSNKTQSIRLKTDKGRAIVLRLRKPGLFLPEAKEILLAHQDLEDAGFRVNYHTGKMHAPGGHALTMIKSGAVWQIPVMPPPKHTVLAATTTAPATTTLASTTMQDVDRMHEVPAPVFKGLPTLLSALLRGGNHDAPVP